MLPDQGMQSQNLPSKVPEFFLSTDEVANLELCGKSSVILKLEPKLSDNSIKSDEIAYKCNDCAKSYKFSATLKRHVMDVHSGAQSWPCQFCDKVYSIKSTLQKHLSINRECHEKRDATRLANNLKIYKKRRKSDTETNLKIEKTVNEGKVGPVFNGNPEPRKSNESLTPDKSQKPTIKCTNLTSEQDASETDEIIFQTCPNMQFGCKELTEPELASGHVLFCAFPPFKEDDSRILIECAIHLEIVPEKIGSKIVFNASLHERGILFCLTKDELFTTFEVVKFKDVVSGLNDLKSKFIIKFTSSDPTAMLLMQPIQVGLRDDAEVPNHILKGYVKVNIEVIKPNSDRNL